MRQLAAAHGDTGWHAHAFPLPVDGAEIVASLVLLADRRAGRRSGWLPWAALAIGTAASLAANIATASHGTISRIIAGWPAMALLIAVKLLSGILEHRAPVANRAGARADDAARRPGPAKPRTSRPRRSGSLLSRPRPSASPTGQACNATAPDAPFSLPWPCRPAAWVQGSSVNARR